MVLCCCRAIYSPMWCTGMATTTPYRRHRRPRAEGMKMMASTTLFRRPRRLRAEEMMAITTLSRRRRRREVETERGMRV